MRSRPDLWRLYCVSEAYGTRPSEVVGVQGDWTAYQFDTAVLTFGRWVEGKLAEVNSDGQQAHTLEKLLGLERERPLVNRAWADPRGLAKWAG